MKSQRFSVTLIKSDEGYAVSCPALRGCHSQGKTKAEALKNIQDAIREWLDAEREEARVFRVMEAQVTVEV